VIQRQVLGEEEVDRSGEKTGAVSRKDLQRRVVMKVPPTTMSGALRAPGFDRGLLDEIWVLGSRTYLEYATSIDHNTTPNTHTPSRTLLTSASLPESFVPCAYLLSLVNA
jgi:hypothetical protein